MNEDTMTTPTIEELQQQLRTALHERNLLRDAIVDACVAARIVNADMAPTIDGPMLLQLAGDLADVGRQATDPAREQVDEAARLWNGLLNCARIRITGHAGVHDHQTRHPDYVHFGAEFWSEHDVATDKPDYAHKVLTALADAAASHAEAHATPH